ncbi:MAG: hypothetical protein GX984_03400 [Erysipelothrix sp.]|nr:hypothetical protein [Erysipelothrix sp.]
MAKNYIEHDIKVKIIDNILIKKNDWEFLIDYANHNFSLEDVFSWEDFYDISLKTYELFGLFLRISNYSSFDFEFKQPILSDLYDISLYENQKITYACCRGKMQTKYGVVRLFIQWVTKQINKYNSTEFYWNLNVFILRNYWQLYNLEGLQKNESFIKSEINRLEIAGFEEKKIILLDNINHVYVPVNSNFLQDNKSYFYNIKFFDYKTPKTAANTWQEKELLNMSGVRLENGEIQPQVVYSDGSMSPNISQWDLNFISDLKKYLSSDIANFVLETVGYYLHQGDISQDVKLKHIDLLIKFLDKHSTEEMVITSSFKLIGDLFKDRKMGDIKDTEEYKLFLKRIHDQHNLNVIKLFKDNGLPLNKKQNQLLHGYIDSKLEKIKEIENANSLENCFNDEDIVIHIDNQYFSILNSKFREIVSGNHSITIASLFLEYMKFLIELNRNQKVERSAIDLEMMKIQQMWEKEFYYEISKELNPISKEMQINSKDLDDLNKEIKTNPIGVITSLNRLDDDGIVKQLKTFSDHAMLSYVSVIIMKPQFPEIEEIIIKENSVDSLLYKKIESITKQYGYKFLNRLPPEKYLLSMHRNFQDKIRIVVSLIDTALLYRHLFHSDISSYDLINNVEDLKIGHLTQLFPLLELKIRDLSTLIGLSPYKKYLSNFMEFRDPSSLLLKIIQDVYEETESFANIPDLMFVYNAMYNHNSLNIRNEAIHARDYLSGGSLEFALKVTIISILLIEQRINLIHS